MHATSIYTFLVYFFAINLSWPSKQSVLVVRPRIAFERGGNPLVLSRESMAGVAVFPSQGFECLPWSYWRYEDGRCRAAKELHAAD